jgi:thiosulfate/3-mercaptopyruvate sulfurtransferase
LSKATVDLAFVERNLVDKQVAVLDARLAERYRGEVEPIDPIPGHIPGALNRPWKANVNADMTFKSAEQLRTEFAAVLNGVHADHVVHQCGSGVTACHNVFAMQLAGLGHTRLYPGSYSEWVAQHGTVRARPVVKEV